MKKIVWRWDCGVYVPFCPHCGEPAYEHDKCVFCHEPYEWVDGEVRPTEVSRGEYTVVQATNNHVHIYQNGQMVLHAACDRKMTEEDLLHEIDLYEKLIACMEKPRRTTAP